MKNLLLAGLLLLMSACAWQQKVPAIQAFDDLTYPFPVQKVELTSGETVAYFDEGQGAETLVFIHGLGSYAPAWQQNIESLRANYRCLAIDLPGYGKSSKGNYEASMTYYAAIVKDFLAALGIEQAHLAGHSMGGQIAITAALAYPELVKSLVLVAPAGFETFHRGEKQWFREVLTPRAVKLTTVDQIKDNIAWNFYDMPKAAEFMITDRIAMRAAADFDAYCYIIPQCVKGMVDEPVYDYLPQVGQPTLVLFGRQDNLIPNRFLHGGRSETIGKAGSERMPNARLVMVEEAGHFVHFERSEIVNAEVSAFLNTVR